MRTLKIHIKARHPDYQEACRQMKESKLLYNQTNFLARQTYFYFCKKKYQLTGNKTVDDWILAGNYNGNVFGFEKLRTVLNAKLRLNSQVVQRIFRQLANDWQSYFKLKKTGLHAKIPNYKQFDYNIVSYSLQRISKKSLRKGFIRPTGFKHGVQLPNWFDIKSIQACSLVCQNGKIWLLVQYKEPQAKQVKGKNIAAIDFGVNDLVAMVYSDKSSPVVIKEKRIKTWNQEWNKTVAKQTENKKHFWSKFLDRVTSKRNLRVEQIINRTANVIVQNLLKHEVGLLILGKNVGWKQKVHIGKRNTQNFVQIPFAKLANNIAYKAQAYGIKVVFQEESYTSKASFVSQEFIPSFDKDNPNKKHKFVGKRVKRGVYKDGDVTIHADINAAFNIMRKNIKNNAIDFWKNKTNIQPLGLAI